MAGSSENNDPATTIIRGAWDPVKTNGPAAVRCVYMVNGASLIGFTLTNGATITADEPGFSLEIEADARLRVSSEGPLPDYYDTAWFSGIRQAFASGGLSVMVNYNYDENIKPLRHAGGKVMTFFKNREEYRRGLVEALLHANARNLTLPAYVDPWSGRIDDLRQFVVPYRLPPFAEPEPFAGTLRDSAGQARILQFGNRCALINAGPGETIAALTFPPGTATIADLSDGVRRPLAPAAGADGHPAVSIVMQPWSLKTLEWNPAPCPPLPPPS